MWNGFWKQKPIHVFTNTYTLIYTRLINIITFNKIAAADLDTVLLSLNIHLKV